MAATPGTEGATAPAETPREWERRVGRPVGAAAVTAAGLLIASLIVQIPVLQEKNTKNEAGSLRSVDKHATAYVMVGVLQLLAMLLIGVVLWYLYRAAKHRREQTVSAAIVLAVVGPIAFGVTSLIYAFELRHLASEFIALPKAIQDNPHAKDLFRGSAAQALGYVTPAAGLSFIFALILGNLNSIRAGLVSSFLGIVGIIAAVLFLLPLGPPQILMAFWLLALAAIMFDRWPGGRGPAWDADEPIKWPTAADRRTAAGGGARPARRGMFSPPPRPQPEPEPVEEATPAQSAQTRSSRKRKRKQGRKH